MDKVELKNKIVQTSIDSLDESVKTVRKRIEEIIHTANEYEGDHDMFDPFKDDMMKKKDLQVKKLQKHLEDLKLLHKIDPNKLSEQVEFGSVVITDKQSMFIAVAMGNIQIENKSYYCISTQVPVFKAMQGLKTGDSFQINNNQFTIKELF